MGRELKDKVDYLTSTRMLTSDKYGIWGWDIVGIVLGILLLLWGIAIYDISLLWRVSLIVLGIILLSVCSVRIEKRYRKLKGEIEREI